MSPNISPRDISLALTGGKSEQLPIAQKAFELLESTARARTVKRRFLLDGRNVVGTRVVLEGDDIMRHLDGCGEVWLVAATIGKETDDAISRLIASDLPLAHAYDVAASLEVDAVCERLQAEIKELLLRENKSAAPRFSCGYGDFPLSVQPALLFALDAAKTVGISVNADFTMRPFKSVTAVIGVCDSFKGKPFDCGDCRYKSVCSHKLCARRKE